MRVRLGRWATALVIVLATAASVVGTTWAAGAPQASGLGWTGRGDIRWIINSHAISLIDNYTGSNTLTTSAFDNNRTNETGTVPATSAAIPTKSYPSYSEFVGAVAGLSPGSWVMYDNEDWSFTPPGEQADPRTFMAEFVATAHQHGLHAILVPGMDIVGQLACHHSGDPSWQNYLVNCNIPEMAGAARPDAFEVQGQSLQNDTNAGPTVKNCGCYAWVVQQAANQARAVTGEQALRVYGGLATNHNGVVSTGQNLYQDSLHTQDVVAGYWLNVPVRGQYCPACSPDGAPQVAVDYLHLLGY